MSDLHVSAFRWMLRLSVGVGTNRTGFNHLAAHEHTATFSDNPAIHAKTYRNTQAHSYAEGHNETITQTIF